MDFEYLDKLYIGYGFVMEYLPFIIIGFLAILICIFFAICIFSFRFLRFLGEFTEFKNIFKNYGKEGESNLNEQYSFNNEKIDSYAKLSPDLSQKKDMQETTQGSTLNKLQTKNTSSD